MTRRGGDDAWGYHMLSHPLGRHHTEGGDDAGEGGRRGGGGTTYGDTTEGGTTCGVPRVVPPRLRRPPLQCGVSQEGGTTCGIPVRRPPPPPCRPPSPASSPPSVWCLPRGWDNMWYPRASSPPLRVVPPRPRRPPLQCGVSQEGGTTCGVPVRRPPCVCRLPVVFQVQDVSNSSQVSPCVVPPPVRRPPCACVVPPWLFLLNVLLKPFSIARDTGLMTGMPLSTYPYG